MSKLFKVNINFNIKIPIIKIKEFAIAKGIDYNELMENLDIQIPELIDKYIKKNIDFFLEQAYNSVK